MVKLLLKSLGISEIISPQKGPVPVPGTINPPRPSRVLSQAAPTRQSRCMGITKAVAIATGRKCRSTREMQRQLGQRVTRQTKLRDILKVYYHLGYRCGSQAKLLKKHKRCRMLFSVEEILCLAKARCCEVDRTYPSQMKQTNCMQHQHHCTPAVGSHRSSCRKRRRGCRREQRCRHRPRGHGRRSW
jgi:hypothetical protein